MTYQLNEAEYSAYLVTGSLARGVNNHVFSSGFYQVFMKRYDLWPGLKEQMWLDRFMKACKDFRFHFTMGDERPGKGGGAGYDPKNLGVKGNPEPPPESSYDYRSKEEIDADPNAKPGVISMEPTESWQINKSQVTRFINNILRAKQIQLESISLSSLEKLAPLRPFSLFAVVLGYQFPNFMLHYFVQSLTAVAIRNGCYTIDTVRRMLGMSEDSTNMLSDLNRGVVNRFITNTNDMIDMVFPGKASLSILGDNKDKIMQEWNETTRCAKLFAITLAPRSK